MQEAQSAMVRGLECRSEALPGPCRMRRPGEKGQAVWVAAGRYSCMLQPLLGSLSAQKAAHELLRDITGVHPGLAAIQHGRSEIRVAYTQSFRFLEEDESHYLLAIR